MNCPLCDAPSQAGTFCTECGGQLGGSSATTAAAATPPRASESRTEQAGAYLKLQPSEMAVFQAASRLFAAYVASNQVTEESEAALMRKAVTRAIQLAALTEKNVQSDDEEW